MEQENGSWQGASRLLMGLGREGGEERGANGGKVVVIGKLEVFRKLEVALACPGAECQTKIPNG